MPEQKEIDLRCVREVMAHARASSWGFQWRDVFRDLLDNLPLVRALDLPGGEEDCLDAMGWDPESLKKPWPKNPPGMRNEVLAMLRDLCNYPPETREQILRAALDEMLAPDRERYRIKQERAEIRNVRRARFNPILRRAIRALAPRERAILRVVYELEEARSEFDADFWSGWTRAVESASVKPLRDDPALRELMALFDGAHSVNTTAGK